MYGSSFIIWTLKPAASSKQPIELAARPFPRLETTPPVTNMYLVICFVVSVVSRLVVIRSTCFAFAFLLLEPPFFHLHPDLFCPCGARIGNSCRAFIKAPTIVGFSAAFRSNSSDVRCLGLLNALRPNTAPMTSKRMKCRVRASHSSLRQNTPHPLQVFMRVDTDRLVVDIDNPDPCTVLESPQLLEHSRSSLASTAAALRMRANTRGDKRKGPCAGENRIAAPARCLKASARLPYSGHRVARERHRRT